MGQRALAVIAFLLVVGCSKPKVAECDAMLDRYLDMTEDDDPALAGLTGAPRSNVRSERIGQRRASMAYLDAERRCTEEVPKSAYDCAMKAPTPNDWEACLTP